MYIPKGDRQISLLSFTGCDEKKCPWKDCVRHPESGFTYNSMGHLSYLCKKFKEAPKEVEEVKEKDTKTDDSKNSN